MKLAVVGDFHISDANPSARLDNFKETCFNKLKFIRDETNRRGVDVVLFLGDIFHRKNPNLNSHDTIRELISIFAGFNSKVLEVVGNHDISMTSKNLYKQPLSVLDEAGSLSILGYPYTRNFTFSTEEADIYGLGYADINDTLSENYFALNSEIVSNFKVNILAMHQMLLPDNANFFGDYLNFKDLAQLDFDIVLCGHFHPGYEPLIQAAHGVIFCNPGAITRGSLDTHNLTREPQFAIFDITDKKNIKTDTVSIPCLPANQIFDMQKVKRSIIVKEDMSKFTDTLKSVCEDSVDISSVNGLLSVLADSGCDKEVLNFAKPYLEQAEEKAIL